MKHYTRWFAIFAAMLFASFAFAQEGAVAPVKPQPQEVVVRIEQGTAPAAVAKATTVAQKANEWVEFGKNVGSAMDAGLSSLTKNANEFAHTDAGKFTMAVIAWKVAGNDAIALLDRAKHVVIGVPFLIAWTVLFIWFYRRNYVAYSVLATKSGPFWNRTRTYKTVNEDNNWGEGKTCAAVITGLAYGITTIAIAVNIIF